MHTFLRYLLEHPNETDNAVPVSVYLPNTPDVSRPDRVQMLLQAYRDKTIDVALQQVPLALCVPTQATVSQPKVMHYMQQSLADDKPPVVVFVMNAQYSRGAFLVIDGHHRLCGCAVAGDAVVSCHVLDSHKAQSLDSSLA